MATERTPEDNRRIGNLYTARWHLEAARQHTDKADAPKTHARINAALSSLAGAIRHAELAPFRRARQKATP